MAYFGINLLEPFSAVQIAASAVGAGSSPAAATNPAQNKKRKTAPAAAPKKVYTKAELPANPPIEQLRKLEGARCWISFRKWTLSDDWVHCTQCKMWLAWKNVRCVNSFSF